MIVRFLGAAAGEEAGRAPGTSVAPAAPSSTTHATVVATADAGCWRRLTVPFPGNVAVVMMPRSPLPAFSRTSEGPYKPRNRHTRRLRFRIVQRRGRTFTRMPGVRASLAPVGKPGNTGLAAESWASGASPERAENRW